MNLRQKTLLLTTLPIVGLVLVLYSSLSSILLRSFAHLEEQTARRNVQRIQEALVNDLSQLSITTKDWASWDDTYAFVANRNPAYITSNLTISALDSLQLNFIVFLNLEGEVVFGKGLDLNHQEELALPATLLQQFWSDPSLLEQSQSSPITGLVPTRENALLIASQPILKSDETGPVQGTLIMGRYLDANKVQDLAQRTQLNLDVFRVDSSSLTEEFQSIITVLQSKISEIPETINQSPILIQTVNQELVEGYTLLPDLNGRSLLLLEVALSRDIYRQGQISLRYLAVSVAIVSATFVIILLILLERIVLKPLTRLSEAVEQIGQDNDLSYRIPVPGDDELGRLAQTMNCMLGKLQISNQKLAEEQQKAERLLLNILPEPIAIQLKQSHHSIAQHFDEVTILFADIVDFTPLSQRLEPIALVNLLNQIFSSFDELAERLHLEKIKTIGDAYMVAAGLPLPRSDHAESIAEMALAMQEAIAQIRGSSGERFQIRIGINTGVVVAGVIGTKKFIYDLWGDAVNIASRMESSAQPGSIQVTEVTYQRLKEHYILEERGSISVRGRGDMITYWLLGRRELPAPSDLSPVLAHNS